MHVKSDEAYAYIDMVEDKISSCHYYISELNLNDPELNNLHQYFLLEDGHLSDLLRPKIYAKWHRVIYKAFQVDLDVIGQYKPLIISNMLAESILTATYDLALDHQLWKYALEQGKSLHGLESAKDQYRILINIPMEYQLKALKDIVKNITKFKAKITKINEYYANRELTKLYKYSKKSMGELRKLMIYDRNEYMAEQLVHYLDKSTFCAVGAAHLPGNKGMLALLKRRGYRVKPIFQ